MSDDLAAQRIAENNARFRSANERIARVAGEQGLGESPIPFVCECSDPGCVQIVALTLDDYRGVRDHPRRFLHATGHEHSVAGVIETVEERDGWVLVEKIGRAGEVVENLAQGEEAGR